MSEWKKVKLDELYEVHNGLSKGRQFFGTGFPFLTFSNVFNNWFLPEQLESLVQTTDKERDACSIKAGDVFITRTSETMDELTELVSNIGIKAGDLTQMSVDLLQPDISLEQYKKLDLIAQMMTEQKNVSLVMVQQFNLKSAIEDQALFNIKRAYYEQQNSAIGSLTLLDIENIQKINTGDIGLKRYAEELTGKKGKITVTAVEYYTTDSLQQQILRQADMRNAILTRYLTQQKDISPKRISITTDSLSNLTAYKGQNRYEVSSQLEDEE